MFKRFVCSILFISFSVNGYAQEDEIDSKLFLNIQTYNVALGGVVLGLGKWLDRNYEVCAANGVYVAKNTEVKEPDRVGCYVIYGPVNEGMTKWRISAYIVEKEKDFGFEFEFAFGGREFMFIDFNYYKMDMTKEKFQKIVLDIVNSDEAKRFGKR